MTGPTAALARITAPCHAWSFDQVTRLPAGAWRAARDRLGRQSTAWRDAVRDSDLPLPVAAGVASIFTMVRYLVGDDSW